jgi:hypothetical protein
MRDPAITDSILSVIESGLPLAVRCGYCPRRVLIRRERLANFAGNYRVCALPLVCSCGSKDVAAFILETPDEAETFIEPNSTLGNTQPGSCRPTF